MIVLPLLPLLALPIRFHFPAMRVGVAEYEEGPTGTTVLYFPRGEEPGLT